MEKNESLSKVLVNYGPREEQVINEIKDISKKIPIPDNKNEVFRRGIHAVRYLAEVDEEFLLSLLSQLLHLCATRYDVRNLRLAKELAFTVYAIQVAKYGVLRSEIFDSIPRELQLIEQLIENKKPKQAEIENEFKKTMKKLANSVDTIFRKPEKNISTSSVLFPILFLDKMPRIGKINKILPDYEDLCSDTKMHFLVDAMCFAEHKNELEVKKKSKELTI